MKLRRRIAVIVAMVALCAGVCAALSLNERITLLENKIVEYEDRVSQVETSLYGTVAYDRSGYNYLAIGNSITVHGKCDYWWNEIGMAASRKDKDYFHQVTSWLESQHGDVTAYTVNFSAWEIQSYDRAETFEIIKPYLSPELDLVTIQLSENVTNFSTFEKDYVELINYIKDTCPDAEIIIIDDFWSAEKSVQKEAVAKACGVSFVSLVEIRGDSSYTCGMGTIVYGDDGVQHPVEHEGVAMHPGDKGMKYIADGVIMSIQQTEQGN